MLRASYPFYWRLKYGTLSLKMACSEDVGIPDQGSMAAARRRAPYVSLRLPCRRWLQGQAEFKATGGWLANLSSNCKVPYELVLPIQQLETCYVASRLTSKAQHRLHASVQLTSRRSTKAIGLAYRKSYWYSTQIPSTLPSILINYTCFWYGVVEAPTTPKRTSILGPAAQRPRKYGSLVS